MVLNDYVPRAPGGPMHPVYLDQTIQPKFILCSNWADDIKGGKSRLFESAITSENNHFSLAGVSEGQGVRCKSWHFLDLPITRPNDTHPHPFAKSNAQAAFDLAVKALRDEQSKPQPDRRKEAFWLYFLVHIVGDLHQPLHCASSYVLDSAGDDGGNLFHINQDTSLHSFWDAGIDHAIDAQPELRGVSASSVAMHWLAEPAYRPTLAEANDLVPMHWIERGRQLAIHDAYTLSPNTEPSDDYVRNQVDVCKRQALLGGYRLAAILNKVLKRN